MRKWIHALTLMLALSAAFPSAASTLSIADANDNGLFAPPSLISPYRADDTLHWIMFDLDANSTVRFGQPQNAGQLQLGDIMIAGANAATGITLALANQGGIVFTRLISTGSISLAGNTASFSGSGISRAVIGIGATGGTLCLGLRGCVPQAPLLIDPLFSLDTLQVQPSGNLILLKPGVISLAVPEPATPWLVVTLLPILILLGRKRTSRAC